MHANSLTLKDTKYLYSQNVLYYNLGKVKKYHSSIIRHEKVMLKKILSGIDFVILFTSNCHIGTSFALDRVKIEEALIMKIVKNKVW